MKKVKSPEKSNEGFWAKIAKVLNVYTPGEDRPLPKVRIKRTSFPDKKK